MKLDQDVLINSSQCRERLGNVSNMTIWRWLRDERLRFPKPRLIRRRRYWSLKEIERWVEGKKNV